MAPEIFTAREGFVAKVDGIDYTVEPGEHRSDSFPPVVAHPHLWAPFSDPAAPVADPGPATNPEPVVEPHPEPAPAPVLEPEPDPEPKPDDEPAERFPRDGDIDGLRAYATSLGLELRGNVSRADCNAAIDAKLGTEG